MQSQYVPPKYQPPAPGAPPALGNYGGAPTAADGNTYKPYVPPTPFTTKPVAGGTMPGMGNDSFTPYSAPGYGEEWWKQHGNEFTQPGPAQNYWNGQQGFFANPQQGESDAYGYSQQLGGTTGAMEGLYDQYKHSGEFTNPWAAEGAYQQNQQAFQTPGSMEQFWQQHQSDLSGPSQLALHQQGIERDIASARATQDFWGSQGGNLAKNSYNENLANNYRSTPSFSEDFYTGGGATQGLDAVYDRLYSQGTRKIDNAAAARGGYNSGAALRANEEFGADTNAQHVKDIQAAAAQGDASKMARLKYELDLGTGADTSLRGRISTGIEGAHTADQSGLERAGASQKLYEGLGNETRQNLTTGGLLAGKSQDSALARILGQTTAASAADRSRADRDTLNTNSATASGRERTDRLKTASDIGLSAQDAALRRIAEGGDLSTRASNERQAGLTGGAVASGNAERLQIDRESGVMRNLMSVADNKATKYAGMTQDQRNAEWVQEEAAINGQLANKQIDADQAEQMRNYYMELLKIPLSVKR